jgi:hypothetical protein
MIKEADRSGPKLKLVAKKRMTDVEIRSQLETVPPMENKFKKMRPGLKMKANLTLRNSGSSLNLPRKKFSEDYSASPIRKLSTVAKVDNSDFDVTDLGFEMIVPQESE